MQGNFLKNFLSFADFFSKVTFLKNFLKIPSECRNSLDPDQAQQPGLDPNCLPRLSADKKSQRERVQN